MRRIGWIVVPLMLAELLLATLMVINEPSTLTWIGAGLLLTIWTLTGSVHVSQHRRLAQEVDYDLARRLARSNIFRTVLWVGRGGVAAALL